ncbi:sigma-70 family RNA polymerase sigma factor [Marisediminicola sp. LYQ134]|uniref:sigma-70 family RNA polymerase sigma factor n=1 Tax=unclassified Marisediminicola TaxID=2618316 RepID=UPI0039834793
MTSSWEGVATTLVERRGTALLRYARFVTGDAENAGDLVHDALVKTFGRLSNGFTIEGAEAYVRRAILTAHIDATRRRSRWRRIAHLTIEPAVVDSSDAATGSRLDLWAQLRRLSPRERACLVLRYYDDLTVAAIARELEISEGTVKRYLSDGLAKLAAALGADDPTSASPVSSPSPSAPPERTEEHHGR